jgi:SAM-dependent methyltransferase
MITEEKTNVWSHDEYAGVYSRLETFAPKELHDKEIVDLVHRLVERDGLVEEDKVMVAEVGAGPAPISRLLNQNGYECKAFDLNPDMSSVDFPVSYENGFDLTSPEISEEDKGKYDVVVMENVWYATTLSPEGTRKYTQEEAQILRLTALKKAASLLRPGGFMILSDPMKQTENFGLKRIWNFLEFDQKARLSMHQEGKTIGGIMLEYMKDPQIKEILKRNKNLMKKAVLLNEEKVKELIISTGMFDEIVYSQPETYLGSNLTMALRRNGLELNESDISMLGTPIVLKGKVHENILSWIGKFRRKVYSQSETTDNLPEVDNFDLKEGVVVVYPSKNKLGLAAVATLQPSGDIGLDAEELMVPQEGEFYNYLAKKIAEKSPVVKKALERGEDIEFAEIRRLAADNLGRGDAKKFLNSLCEIFKEYAWEKDIGIVLFMSDDKRFRLFNLSNSEVQFQKVEGFALDRKDEHLQTMMISAANYFFKDWESYLNGDEIVLVNQLRKLLVNGDTWLEIIKDHPQKAEIEIAVKKILNSSQDNVSVYYTDYSMKG